MEGTFKPEVEESFLPRHEVKTQIIIGSRPNCQYTSSDFSAKTVVHKKEGSEVIQPEAQTENKEKTKENVKYFLDQSPVDSENENESNDSDIENQVDKLIGA